MAPHTDVPGTDGRDIAVLRPGVKLDGEAPSVTDPPPTLGQHNEEIYGALGINAAELPGLAEDGVI